MLAKTNAWEVSKVLFDASALVIKRKETKSFNVKLILVIVVAQDPTSLSVSFIVNLLVQCYLSFNKLEPIPTPSERRRELDH